MDDQKENRGSADFLNSLINQGINLYSGRGRALGLGRFVFSGASRFAINPVTVTIILVVVGVMLVFVLGNVATGTEITPPEQTTTATISASLAGQFNITGSTDSQKQEILSALSDAMRFPTYTKLLTSRGAININLSSGCGGFVSPPYTDIELRVSECSGLTKFYLTHETGHIIAGRNGNIWQRFQSRYYGDATSPGFLAVDKGCYDSQGFLVTYPRSSAEGNPDWESFAEAVALFMYPRQYPNKLQDFSTQCQATYGWIRDNIYQERQ